jgi:DNA-directed RNA polymerase subunit beta
MPLVRALGATDNKLREAWGQEVFAANYPLGDGLGARKLYEKFLSPSDLKAEPDPAKALVAKFHAMALDPHVNKRTLGQPHAGLTLDAVLDATKRVLSVHRGEAEPDDRDHMAYQRFLGPEDLFAERLAKDHGRVRRAVLNRASFKGNLQSVPSSALRAQVESALLTSGLGNALEEINPTENLDKQFLVTRMGEGGIGSADSVPDEARSVQPSHLGFVDPLRTPESARVGVDVYFARGARKNPDGSVSAQFRNTRTGQVEWKTPEALADATVAFPGELARVGADKTQRVATMRGGKYVWAKPGEVDYELPHFEDAFSPLANLVPLKSTVKGQRVAMASRMLTQALPLTHPEAPFVRGQVPGAPDKSFEEEYAHHVGAERAEKPGRVESVTPDEIVVRHDDGTRSTVDLYNNFPNNRKTRLHQEAVVMPGDRVAPGQLLARSNYTDEKGHIALGRNARVAYIPWGGKNYEDALVVSESFAKKLTSEHMYQHSLDVDDRTKLGKKAFMAHFPGRHEKRWVDAIGDDGVVKPGTVVEYGQPLVLGVREQDRAANRVHKPGQTSYADASVLWEHHDPGIVTDVAEGRDGPVVSVRSQHRMQVGDKLSGRYGDKGVLADIIPDHKMPHDRDGVPYEALLNPLGVISRTNPSQVIEASLGKISEKTGKPYVLEDFAHIKDWTAYAQDELRRHGLSDVEDVYDPNTGRKTPGVLTGNRFLMKLHHTSESKGQGRSSGAYSSDEAPAKGGASGSKRVSLLDTNALLAHGATGVLRDASAVRGQKNDEWWLRFMQGHNPPAPRVPMVYEKFVHQLKAAGIDVVRHDHQTHVMALTKPAVDALAEDRVLDSGDTVRFDRNLEPVPGGLFDEKLTGGHGGRKWASVALHEPLPNPVMEEPIRRILGLTQKQFEGVLSGQHALSTGSGPAGLARALEGLNVKRELALARAQLHGSTKGARDAAVRRLGFLKTLERLDMHPRDWVLDRVPVLPPAFRPVSLMGSTGTPLVADANYLYKELIEANRNLRAMDAAVGTDNTGPERLALYRAFKAVTGLGDPIGVKTQEKNVKGILKGVFGSSPKFGTVQRRLISSTVDNVGRGVVAPDPTLDMDSIGLPEDLAFSVYERFAVRHLVRRGMKVADALREVRDRTPRALEALVSEMDARPVIVNRAPVLHKFGILAHRPRLVKGHTLRVSPLVVKGYGMDFDGDAVQFHVPTTEEARREALELMLPSRALLSPADMKTPVHMPGQEYVGGLFTLTEPRQGTGATRYYRSKSEAVAAYRRGEINADTPVVLLRG